MSNKHNIFYLLFLIAGYTTCFSQYFDKTDSLTSVIEKEKDPCKTLYARLMLAEAQLNLRITYWDSLITEAKNCSDKLSESAALNNAGYLYSIDGNIEKALSYYNESILLQMEAKDYSAMCNTINNIGNIYHHQGNLPKAIEAYNKSLEIYTKLGDKEGIANCLMNLGYIYQDHHEIEKSLEYYKKAEHYYREVDDLMGLGSALNNIGSIYSNQKNYFTAKTYYLQSLDVRTRINDLNGLGYVNSNLSQVYFHLEKMDSAFLLQEKALEIRLGLNDVVGIANSYANLSKYHAKIKNPDQALKNAQLSLQYAQLVNYPDVLDEAYYVLSTAYELKGDHKQSMKYYKDFIVMRDSLVNDENKQMLFQKELESKFAAEKLSLEKESKIQQMLIEENNARLEEQQIRMYALFGGIFLMLGVSFVLFRNYRSKKKAFHLVEKQKEEIERLSIVASETDNVVIIMDPNGKLEWVNESFEKLNAITLDELRKLKGETIFDVSNNPHIKEIVAESIKNKKSYTYESFNATRDGKKVWESSTLTPIFSEDGNLKKLIIIDTDITKRKNAEEQVIQKNKDITDSINYAKRIQDALLIQEETLTGKFSDHFIFFKPKDIVSGDFYWTTERQSSVGSWQSFYLAVCDSTGHGVPGAFMSLLNMSYFNEAIIEKKINDPGEIFNHVRQRLISSMEGRQDGMDATLVCFEKNKIHYSAAYNNPLLVRNGDLHELEADKMPVGKSAKSAPFRTFSQNIFQSDTLYFYTDGYADQFGGENLGIKKSGGKKFKEANLKKLLISLAHLPMKEQKQQLESRFEEWKGDLEQIDDVCIIGIKI
ncbi:MAG: tetratricopeptide repeat protein [Bacteroidota bacterium]